MKDSPTAHSAARLDERSLHLRRVAFRAFAAADKGHVASAFSLIEILRTLYDHVIRHDPARPTWPDRDRVIVSKGHACVALYAVLADHGYFPLELLDSFCARGARLGGHPERQLDLGIEVSTGALGHGLPFGVGVAIAQKRMQTAVRVFVVVGDGELAEGSNWEALLLAKKHKLDNLVLIVDQNGQQQGGSLASVLPLDPLQRKLEAFGAETVVVDGHKPELMRPVFQMMAARKSEGPGAVLCETIKGKGLDFAEANPDWHYIRTFKTEWLTEINSRLRARQEGSVQEGGS